MAKVKIDGIEVEVPDGTNMIEAAKQVNVEIPHYCYHPHLSVAGNCRMCLVDIEAGGRGPDIACNMGARDGLEIRTDTPNVKQMRKSVMEFLLANHPLDCPICDQAGECRLQDYYMDYGKYRTRFADQKVTKAKRQRIGDHVVLDSERCVQCSRCVRFGDEVTKTGELRLFNRTDQTEIGVFPGDQIEHKYQGCLSDICPVGALTDEDFRFEKRVWYMKTVPGVCDGCATGCNVDVDHDQGQVFRVRPRRNDSVNDSWMCDIGRIDPARFSGIKRIMRSRVGEGDKSTPDAISHVAEMLRNAAPESVAVVLGARATNEANWAMAALQQKHLPQSRLFLVDGNHEGADGYHDDLLVSQDKNPNRAGAAAILAHCGGAGDKDALIAGLESGDIQVVLVLEDDLLHRIPEHKKPAGGLVYFGAFENGTSAAADVVIGVAASVEQDGTFTNRNGRVQRIRRAIGPLGDALPAYRVVDGLAESLGDPLGTATGAKAFALLAGAVPGFQTMTYQTLGLGGQVMASTDATANGPAE